MPLLLDLTPLRVSVPFRRMWLGTSLSGIGTALTTVAVGLTAFPDDDADDDEGPDVLVLPGDVALQEQLGDTATHGARTEDRGSSRSRRG